MGRSLGRRDHQFRENACVGGFGQDPQSFRQEQTFGATVLFVPQRFYLLDERIGKSRDRTRQRSVLAELGLDQLCQFHYRLMRAVACGADGNAVSHGGTQHHQAHD